MSHALLTAAALLALAGPPAVPLVKPPELPTAMLERVRALICDRPAMFRIETAVKLEGIFDKTARPLHLRELAELGRWLAVRPDDLAKRRRAIVLADVTDQPAVKAAHVASLGGTLAAAVANGPRTPSRLTERVEWLYEAGRQAEAEASPGRRCGPTRVRLTPGGHSG